MMLPDVERTERASTAHDARREDSGAPSEPQAAAPGANLRRFGGDRGNAFAFLETLHRNALALIFLPDANLSSTGGGSIASYHAALACSIDSFFNQAKTILTRQLAEFGEYPTHSFGPRKSIELQPRIQNPWFKVEALSPAERKVFVEMAKGKPNKIIAYELSVSQSTVKSHISSILKKFHVRSRSHAIALFITGAEGVDAPTASPA